jgi:prephenate dehydrogenase
MTSRPEERPPATPDRPSTTERPRRAQLVGTGLIGGSIGLALRARGWHVTGDDLDPARAADALAMGAVDRAGRDPDAEIAFVATPLGAAVAAVRDLLASGRSDLVVTDVCGVKSPVVAGAGHPRFVGGHPMAGSEQAGLAGAEPGLFEGATWVLTPTGDTELQAFSRLRDVVASLGADVMTLSPADHDRLVAMVSHVPHLVAAALMNAAARGAKEDAALLRLAAGGFRDMTRVAAGQPGIWPDICADNAGAITAALDVLLADLSDMRRRVAAADRTALLAVLEEASTARRALPARASRPNELSELRMPVPDREGVLAEITAVAGGLGINIYDIEIAHSAEGPRGVLMLLVARGEAERLRRAVTGRGYRCSVQELR